MQVWLSTYDILLSPGIKGLILPLIKMFPTVQQ